MTNLGQKHTQYENLNVQDVLHKEIDLIQGCISRMSQHSFYLKGWLISLIAVLIAVTDKSEKTEKILIINIFLILITCTFWYLNAYFLRLERLYRKLYEWVISNRLKTYKYVYDLNLKDRFKEKSIVKTMFSSTVLIFYGTTSILLIAFLIYNLSLHVKIVFY